MDAILRIWGGNLQHPFVYCFLVSILSFNLPGKGGPANSCATTFMAVRVIGVYKPSHLVKVMQSLGRGNRNLLSIKLLKGI